MIRPGRRRFAALVAGTVVAAGSTLVAAAPAGAVNFYGDAGYRVTIRAGEVSAEWRVPAIRSGSRLGSARTFVYANYQPSLVLLELGTIESEVSIHGRHVARYSAFWNRNGYSANTFHSVNAGDLVKAEAALKRKGWELTMIDYTGRWQHTVTNPGVGKTSITRVGWLQEDPSTASLPTPLQDPLASYPEVAPVVFTHLSVNNKAPQLAWSGALYIETLGGEAILPTRPSGDGFSLQAASGATLQYMVDVAPYNFAFRRFNYLVDLWTGKTTGSERYSQSQPFLAAIEAFVRRLSSQHWPGTVRSDILDLAAVDGQVAGLLQQLPSLSLSQLASWEDDVIKVLSISHSIGYEIHADLGMPATV
ncbi:MAG TPA: hypothetical protein VMD59_23550 [Acidimicrobiales bacterium]|nr:hypothetical protein [Acidimicrobiales bacterium]